MTINYPQIVSTGDTFAIISTAGYLTRAIILFSCAALFIFSLIMFLSTRMKNSFSMLILTGFITLVGYVVTHVNASLQTFWNPFQLFRMSQVASELPKNTDWLYLLSTLSWASLLLVLAILLPEGERGLFQASEQRKPFASGKTRRLSSVWNSSLFEWRKMKRRGHLKQLYIVFGLSVIVGYFVVAQQAHEKESVYIEGLKSRAANLEDKYIPGVQHQIDSIDKELEMAEESGNEAMATYYRDGSALASLENTSTILKEEFLHIKNAMDGFEKGDWIPLYAYQLHQNELSLEYASQLKKMGNVTTQSYLSMEAGINEKDWLMKRNIQPVFSGENIPTIYDNWGDREKEKSEWEEKNRKVDNSGLYTLYLYFENYLYFIPMILFLFLVGAGFANERGKRTTLRLLKTQPITEKSIFLGKLLTANVVALVSGVAIFLFVVLIGTVLNRFGDWYYPIFRYYSKKAVESPDYTGLKAFEGGYDFIPLGNYLVESIALFLCILLFLIVLSNFLSVFSKQSLGVFVSVILIGGIGYVLSQKLIGMAHLSPFTYFNITKIMNGEISTLLNNPGITILNGCLLLITASVIFIVLGYLLSRKARI